METAIIVGLSIIVFLPILVGGIWFVMVMVNTKYDKKTKKWE
jgi:hypothetical protein